MMIKKTIIALTVFFSLSAQAQLKVEKEAKQEPQALTFGQRLGIDDSQCEYGVRFG